MFGFGRKIDILFIYLCDLHIIFDHFKRWRFVPEGEIWKAGAERGGPESSATSRCGAGGGTVVWG